MFHDCPSKHEQIEATRASIAKWEKNRDESNPLAIRLGWSQCPLCRLTNANCSKCPVRRISGESGCAQTPYRAASEALDYWKQAHNNAESPEMQANRRSRWQYFAQEEVSFLEIVLMGLEEGSI